MTHIFDQTVLGNLQILVTLFVAVLFLQAGFDKVVDFKGNKAFLTSYFAKTFLKSTSPTLFIVIVILEVAAGILCLAGAFMQFSEGMKDVSLVGLQVAALSIFCLFTGQRIAKDYAGAGSMVSYFILCILGILLFTLKG